MAFFTQPEHQKRLVVLRGFGVNKIQLNGFVRKRRHFGSTSAGPSGTGKAGKWYRSDGQLVPAPRKTHERRFRADRLSITVIAVPLLLDEAALTPLQYLGLSWNHPEFEIHKLLHISGS